MEKSCRWCAYFNAKERKCDRLESGSYLNLEEYSEL